MAKGDSVAQKHDASVDQAVQDVAGKPGGAGKEVMQPREATEAALHRVDADVRQLEEDIKNAATVIKAEPKAQNWLKNVWARVSGAFQDLLHRAEVEEEPKPPPATEAELSRSRALLVKFDSDRPSVQELAHGMRELLSRLGNPVLLPEAFGDPLDPRWKFNTDSTMEFLRHLFEVKRKAEPGKGPLYDQGIRLTHAIQEAVRKLRQPMEWQNMPNAFLRQEDFSEDMKRKEQAHIDQMRREFESHVQRKEAAIATCADELLLAFDELGINVSTRMEKFIGDGLKGRALSFQQLLDADSTFRRQYRDPSMFAQLEDKLRSRDSDVLRWAGYASEMTRFLEQLTARGSTVDTVILPERPASLQKRPKKEAARVEASGSGSGASVSGRVAAK